MNRYLRVIALCGAALSAAVVPFAPAEAATTVRRATITVLQPVGTDQVLYNGEAVQVTPSLGYVAVTCEFIPVGTNVIADSTCVLYNLDTGESLQPAGFSAARVGGQVLVNGGRLELCMRAGVMTGGIVHYGPNHCALLQ